jgi:hypothetical protein
VIQVGSKVRSFDFPHNQDISGERACYVEGEVEGFKEVEGCQRYIIRVDLKVFGGKEEDILGRYPYVYPPVNGTPRMLGGVTNFVELV